MGIHNPQLTLTQVSALRWESTDVAGCKASTAPLNKIVDLRSKSSAQPSSVRPHGVADQTKRKTISQLPGFATVEVTDFLHDSDEIGRSRVVWL